MVMNILTKWILLAPPPQGVDGCEGNRLCFPKMSCNLIDWEINKQEWPYLGIPIVYC
jgi:hypothetical protein